VSGTNGWSSVAKKVKRQEALTHYDFATGALRSELANLRARLVIAEQQVGVLWMQVLCGPGTLMAIRVVDGEMDLDTAKTLREYLNIWITHAERESVPHEALQV
jgi:hypothetical protein